MDDCVIAGSICGPDAPAQLTSKDPTCQKNRDITERNKRLHFLTHKQRGWKMHTRSFPHINPRRRSSSPSTTQLIVMIFSLLNDFVVMEVKLFSLSFWGNIWTLREFYPLPFITDNSKKTKHLHLKQFRGDLRGDLSHYAAAARVRVQAHLACLSTPADLSSLPRRPTETLSRSDRGANGYTAHH